MTEIEEREYRLEIGELKHLCARAAQALEAADRTLLYECGKHAPIAVETLIRELREAAQ